VALAGIPLAVKAPGEFLKLTARKFKLAFKRTPIGVFYLGVCGIAMQFCTRLPVLSPSSGDGSFMHRTRRFVGIASFVSAYCSCILAVCGLSFPWLKAGILLAPVAIMLCRVSPTGRRFGAREPHDSIPYTLAMISLGFVLMTFFAFGLPRFTRPFLPALYLSATACIPLGFRLLSADRLNPQVAADCEALP
jgi:hypothetical protein